MYGVPLATFPDPALVFAAAAFDIFAFGCCFGADFALDTIDRSDGSDILVRELREPIALLFLPPIGLRTVIALLTAVDWRVR
jgi:hypothetical protein